MDGIEIMKIIKVTPGVDSKAHSCFKILKPKDIDNLLYTHKLRSEVEAECAALKEQTRKEVLEKIHTEHAELLLKSRQKMDDFTKNLKEELSKFVKDIFAKLRVETKVSERLYALASREIEKLGKKSQRIVIHALPDLLTTLRTQIEEHFESDKNYFEFSPSTTLSSNECLVENDYSVVRVSLDDFEEKIVGLLKPL